MLNILTSAASRAARSFVAFGNRFGWWKTGIGIAVMIAILVGGIQFFSKKTTDGAEVENKRAVEVRSIAELASNQSPLQVVGEVSSKSEADVRAEKSGQVISVNRSLGDAVAAGTIVAEIDSASERAAVLQAQGAVDAAQASLDKVQKGTRSEQLSILQSAEAAARSGAVNTLLSSYSSVDNAIRGTIDKMFSNPEWLGAHFNVLVNDSQLKVDIDSGRVTMQAILKRQSQATAGVTTSSDLNGELTTTEAELRKVRSFIDNIIAGLNKGTPTQTVTATDIATYLSEATAARTAISASLSAIVTSRQSLETAQKNLEQGVTGAQPEDIAAAQAALKQTQGTLAAARANLEKSLIRSPISGTINSFSLKKGDYVSLGTPVLTVANNGALETVAYVTESDAKEIAVGQNVTFDTGATGVVTKIAPALDPLTKRIEVRVGISDPNSTLVNGQSVLVQIARLAPKINTDRITIPISAVKVEADRTTVFTVNADGALAAHEIQLGALLGDRVVVLSGVSSDMRIVVDARGLREGQSVEVK